MSDQEHWAAVELPHCYPDGTSTRWAVRYVTPNGHVEIADWLDKNTAYLIAAAPELLDALRECVGRFASTLAELKLMLVEHPFDLIQDAAANEADEDALNRARAAIAKAEGGAS